MNTAVHDYTNKFLASSRAAAAANTSEGDSRIIPSSSGTASPSAQPDGPPDDLSATLLEQDNEFEDDASHSTASTDGITMAAGEQLRPHQPVIANNAGCTVPLATLLPVVDDPALQDSGETVNDAALQASGETVDDAALQESGETVDDTALQTSGETVYDPALQDSGETVDDAALQDSSETVDDGVLITTATAAGQPADARAMSYTLYEATDANSRLLCALCNIVSGGPHYCTKNSTLSHIFCSGCAHAMKCTHTDPDSYKAHGETEWFMKPGKVKQCSACGLKKKMVPKSPFYYCVHCQLHRVCSTCYTNGDIFALSHEVDMAPHEITEVHNTSSDTLYVQKCNELCSHDNYDVSVSYEQIETWKYSWNPGHVARCCSECNSKSISRSLPMFVCKHCCKHDTRHVLCSTCWNNAVLVTSENGNKKRRRAFLNNKRAWNEI